MYSIIAFATQWGSKYGGINTFNTDFLSAFGVAYHSHVQTICIVASAGDKEIEDAKNTHVTLVKLPYPPQDKIFTKEQAAAAVEELKKLSIQLNPEHTIWLGHDRISGQAAVHAAKLAGGRSALIHHMSYDAYEAFAEDSHSAYEKTQNQKKLFEQANLVLAVGPFLRDALADLLDIPSEQVHTIIPGQAEITPRKTTPKTFNAFLSGRLSDDAAKIKQGHLGIAAFAQAIANANKSTGPENLTTRPKIVLRGVDFESRLNYDGNPAQTNPEHELHRFAEEYAGERVNLQALPYTQDREELYDNLKSASVALMPSWHEGFGLVAWEAIAAGVPLIVSKDSGVYQFIKEACEGTEDGYVCAIKVRGSTQHPYFNEADLNEVAEVIKNIASNPEKARSRAAKLRNMFGDYTWTSCVENVVKHFAWDIQKGSPKTIAAEPSPITTEQAQSSITIDSPLHMPVKYWTPGCGMAESQLLRADEALVPFDAACQPFLDQLDAWLDEPQRPQAIRLITGAGGLGKTRVAIEICGQRLKTGWHCGFLGKSYAASDMAAVWRQLSDINQPLLLVVDYSETRQAALLALIKAMIRNSVVHPVRVLLLARNGGEWWDNLPGKDPECEMLLGGYATSGPFELPALYADEANRTDAYRQALQAYANAIGTDVPDAKPDLAGEHFSKPLYLQMAALLALYGERPATAEGLTRALLNHERRYWADALADSGFNKPENLAQQLLALATLSGGFATAKQAKTYWDEAGDYLLNPSEFTALFEALVPLYPGNQGLQTVQPDLLGEALVAQTLFQAQGEKLLDAVLAIQALQHHALTVIARLSLHRPDLHNILTAALGRNFCNCCHEIVNVAVETPSDLPALAQTTFSGLSDAVKSQAAGLLKPLLVNESVELAHLICEIRLFEKDKSEKKLAKKPNDMTAKNDHAGNLLNLSVALYRTGHNDQAVGFAKEALDIHQRLAQKNPDRFDPDYARSLSNYSNRLSNLGQDDKAVGFAKQALEIFQRLAQKKPDRFDPDYATLLSNYASHLSYVGQDDKAFGFAKQALDIRQRLAHKNPDRYDPDYATSLDNYASHLSNVGQDDEAIGFAKQALDIRQRLSQKKPDRFDPDYATSLSNYASHLSDGGQADDALGFAKQALGIRKRLARKNPARYEFDCYITRCNAIFLSWLSDEMLATNVKPEEIRNFPAAAITDHKKPSALFFSLFVQACVEVELVKKRGLFNQAIMIQDLSKADQQRLRAYFLCICAWLNRYESTALPDHNWMDSWRKFHKQRQGRLPQWMQTVAKRLEFSWPD
ncbi:MAG: tetratricopeptide repeat protein [Methylobacter sp.]